MPLKRVAIIGAGPNGITAALELSTFGFQVDLFEAGYSLLESESLSTKNYLFKTPSLMPEGIHRIGGGSNEWIGRIGEFLPLDFESKFESGEGSWPFQFSELSPYYSKLFNWITGENIGDYELAFRNHNKLVLALPPSLEFRTIRYATPDFFVRILRQLRDSNSNFALYEGVKCVEIRPADINETAYTLIGTSGQELGSGKYHLVLIACGALQTPTLLFFSSKIGTPAARKNIGKHLMEHFDGFIANIAWQRSRHKSILPKMVLDRTRRISGLPTGLALKVSENDRRDEKLVNVHFEFVPKRIRYIFDPNRVKTRFSLLIRVLFITERIIKKLSNSAWNWMNFILLGRKTFSIWVKGEELANPRVALEFIDETDRRVTTYEHIVSRRSKQEFLRSVLCLIDVIQKENLGEVLLDKGMAEFTHNIYEGSNWHPMGTCRMGADEETSVCDPECKVHGSMGVYVIDASCFVSGSNANPTFTSLANTLRVLDTIKEKGLYCAQ
jgi:choline dehydrogenase-like flavoprotein